MKKILASVLALIIVSVASCAFAEIYNFTFTSITDEDGNEQTELEADYEGATLAIDTDAMTVTFDNKGETSAENIIDFEQSDDESYVYIVTDADRVILNGADSVGLFAYYQEGDHYYLYQCKL